MFNALMCYSAQIWKKGVCHIFDIFEIFEVFDREKLIQTFIQVLVKNIIFEIFIFFEKGVCNMV